MGIKEDGSYYPGAESLDNDPARALFADGRIGMKFAYSFDVGVLTDQFPAECDWGVAPIPVADPNKCYMQTASYGSTVMVSKNGVENLGEEVCAEIIRYLYSDETRIELFEQGYSLLVDGSLADQAELADGVHEAWLEFAELAKISIVACSPIQSKVEGNGATAVIKEEIWTGNADIATALQDLTDRSNAGIKVYQEQNPDVDQSDRYDPDWNEKVSSRGSY